MNEIFKEVSMLDDIYEMAEYITKDTVLNDLIQQLSINADKEFEMYPSIGNHKIIFGDATDPWPHGADIQSRAAGIVTFV